MRWHNPAALKAYWDDNLDRLLKGPKMHAVDADLAAIHAAVLADPADDLPRLAYADRLDELGQDPARASLIRAQVAADKGSGCGQWMYSCGELHPTLAALAAKGCVTCRIWAAHRMDGERLLAANADRWLLPVSGELGAFVALFDYSNQSPLDCAARAAFWRGFPAYFHMRLAAWLRHGDWLVARYPVEKVLLETPQNNHAGILSRWDGPDLLVEVSGLPPVRVTKPPAPEGFTWHTLTRKGIGMALKAAWPKVSFSLASD